MSARLYEQQTTLGDEIEQTSRVRSPWDLDEIIRKLGKDLYSRLACRHYAQAELDGSGDPEVMALAEANYEKLRLFKELTDVRTSYEKAYQDASEAPNAPASWTMDDQDPPKQVPHDIGLDDLYAQAESAAVPFFRLLQGAEDLVNARHRQPAPLALKGRARAVDKITRDYDGDACRLLDIVRGSIICRDFDEMNTIIHWLHSEEARSLHKGEVVRIKSQFIAQHAHLTYGYRDAKVSAVIQIAALLMTKTCLFPYKDHD